MFLKNIVAAFDLCLIQEHWLLHDQLSLLNFDPDFCSCGVSGMNDSVLLKGRPFGGCGIIFRKKFLGHIKVLHSPSDRFCSILLKSGNLDILLICVYLPTDYHTEASDFNFNSSLAELCGFIDSQSFDYLLIGGDFNIQIYLSPQTGAASYTSL